MQPLEKQQVLRINCPGFGVESNFSAGNAQPLESYRVIVVNPVSILHLFDKDPELLAQISVAQSEGTTSYVAKSDKVLQSIMPDLDVRTAELANFLKNGGLLVYFLCPPFLIQAPTLTVDNYYWLDILAPDNSTDKNRRNMSSASRGKNVEQTPEGAKSPFAAYFKQPGLEWTTLVRAEKLADGYQILATAGPNKCIAAQLDAGENGGRVIFLPAPYAPDFDKRLMESINLWHSGSSSSPSEAPIAAAAPADVPPVEAALDSTMTAPHTPEAPEMKDQPAEAKQEHKEAHKHHKHHEDAIKPLDEQAASATPAAQADKNEPADKHSHPKEVSAQPDTNGRAGPPEEKAAAHKPDKKHEAHADKAHHKKSEPSAPEPKELMEKMEEISKPAMPVPKWCQEYSFSDLDNLRDQLLQLKEQVQLTQIKITEVEGRITDMQWLKNALLSAEAEELHKACAKVFELLGWKSTPAANKMDELWLKDGETTVSIAKIVRSTSQVKRNDLADLAESVIDFWGEHEAEPKGLMVASTWANRPPSERTEADYTDALAGFAEKKNLCLMTTWQLLCIYRDIECGNASPKELRENILSTSGRLAGFVLDEDLAKV